MSHLIRRATNSPQQPALRRREKIEQNPSAPRRQTVARPRSCTPPEQRAWSESDSFDRCHLRLGPTVECAPVHQVPKQSTTSTTASTADRSHSVLQNERHQLELSRSLWSFEWLCRQLTDAE